MEMTDLPEPVRRSGAARVQDLDVRPLFARGEEPFPVIMAAAKELASDETLHLIAGFRPQPLFGVLRSLGFDHCIEEREGVFHIWFFRTSETIQETRAAAARAPLQDPVEMDVREMEPPKPLIAILTRLGELGPGAQLLVHHHREPLLLYDKLALRGYAARTVKRGEGDFLVHVLPRWALEERESNP